MEWLDPIYIESYKLIYVGPNNKLDLLFKDYKIGIYEIFLIKFILIFAILYTLFYAVLNEGIVRVKASERIFEIASGSLGQANFKIPSVMSIAIVLVLFLFFMYINYVSQSAAVISFMTTEPSKKFTSLESIKRSNIPIYSGTVFAGHDPNGQMNIR